MTGRFISIVNSLAMQRFVMVLSAFLVSWGPALAEPRHGIAMHGEPRLGADMLNFATVRTDAPKGGRLVQGQTGTFDSFRGFNIKGTAAAGLRGYIYQSLMARADDEPFSLYGLVARTIDASPDRRQVTFELWPQARFSDGAPLTSADVVFSHALLRDKGVPFMRSYYAKVASADAPGPHTVRFTFAAGGDRELPLILGLMPILPKHRTDPETFEQTSLEPPVGSGPYRIERFEAGRMVAYRRDPDWWARDLPTVRGRYNFDEVRFDYYRDQNALFEAFKAGEIDVRAEDDPTRWAEGYRFPAVLDGRVVRQGHENREPAGMSAFVFNMRRPMFADVRVRRALILAFDFETLNRQLYSGQYRRTHSFFEPSDLSSFAIPAGDRERVLLAPFPDAVSAPILEGTARLPVSDGRGNNRADMAAAFALLQEAGYVLDGRRLVHRETKKPLAIEMLAVSPAFERLMLAWRVALERLGIAVTIRRVDDSQYWLRLRSFDFDMIQFRWSGTLSPGNEQENRWSSASAGIDGSLNFAGVRNSAADAMIAAMLAATSREDFVAAVRAFDRVLRSGDYIVPLFHAPERWIAWWTRIDRPRAAALAGLDLDTWWSTGTSAPQ